MSITTQMDTTMTSIKSESGKDAMSLTGEGPRKGNLQSLLTTYENSGNDNVSLDGNGPSDISIQLDSIGRERSSTLGSFRERGLTFDSEFDLGLGFSEAPPQDGNGNSGGGVIEFGGDSGNPHRVNANIVSANSSNASGNAAPAGSLQSQLQTQPQQADSVLISGQQTVPLVQYVVQNNTLHPVNSNQVTQNHCSTSGFLSGVFGTNPPGEKVDTPSFCHTPPSAVSTSYEGRHFGKRMRSGSISGRLRSMSDLEDRGIINRQEKGVLKDLIISGDDDLHVALDKYDEGDQKALESIVGRLKNKNSSDIDLIGDLDLDFLSMNAEFGGDVSVPTPQTASKSIPIPSKNCIDSSSQHSNSCPGSGRSTPQVRDQSPAPVAQQSYDGIGELDFNGDYSASFAQQQTYNQTSSIEQAQLTLTKLRSDSLAEFQRLRANSLAFGVLLDEPGTNDEDDVGKWMDRTPATIPEESKPLKKRVSSHVVGANGGLYIINDTTQDAQAHLQKKPDNKKMTKAEIAAMKRLEREEKKALREAERLAKREKKEREAKLKKASKAKQSNRMKKSEAVSKKKKDDLAGVGSDDEPKIVLSGTGRPRSLSDPNLSIGLDENGLMHVDGPPDWVGAYSPESRKIRIERFLAKRNHRVWVKKVKYDVRKNFADSRLRVKGRFVKKEDELLMRDLMSLT